MSANENGARAKDELIIAALVGGATYADGRPQRACLRQPSQGEWRMSSSESRSPKDDMRLPRRSGAAWSKPPRMPSRRSTTSVRLHHRRASGSARRERYSTSSCGRATLRRLRSCASCASWSRSHSIASQIRKRSGTSCKLRAPRLRATERTVSEPQAAAATARRRSCYPFVTRCRILPPRRATPRKRKPAVSSGFLQSGRRDLNSGPLVPQTSALTRLRHAPCREGYRHTPGDEDDRRGL
jgi:hypothetical protein